jgi:hypothetical protein
MLTALLGTSGSERSERSEPQPSTFPRLRPRLIAVTEMNAKAAQKAWTEAEIQSLPDTGYRYGSDKLSDLLKPCDWE